jgi:beta-mannosidase
VARIISISGEARTELGEGWKLVSTAPTTFAVPQELPTNLDWVAASAPGTVAGALAACGDWNLDHPSPLHNQDFWYQTRFSGDGRATLRFEGLATLAEVWLNDAPILTSDNMFLAQSVDVDLSGDNSLHICFRALIPALAALKPRRARWRPRMITQQNLRAVRTTLIGHMPGWCPPVHVVGPWRPISYHQNTKLKIAECDVRSALSGRDGIVRVFVRLANAKDVTASVESGDHVAPLSQTQPGTWEGELTIPDVQLWWPHTHGPSPLYEVRLRFDDTIVDLGRTGFRSAAIDRGPDGEGFTLRINDTPIFCRGAVWSSADVVRLPCGRDDFRPWLELMRDAGMNMVRVPGTMVYEAPSFYELCDEFGILVWQDAMLANFDYPVQDSKFLAAIETEVRQFLDQRQLSPCLTVFCGGSEVDQQAAMLGLPASARQSVVFDKIFPSIVEALRDDLVYVPNSPTGGTLPFSVNAGVTHYFGVSAYLRPLTDARRADVRFASECLVFANIPHEITLERAAPDLTLHHPLWEARTPRDHGSSWDFEDVRDHYLEMLYRCKARDLRYGDPEHYAHASRAVVAEVIEATFSEWRREGSRTAGALILFLQDLWPSPGWGIIDSLGEPKSAYSAVKRACQRTQIFLTDEGLDGLALHVVNESPENLRLRVSLTCLRDGRLPIIDVSKEIDVLGRGKVKLSSAELIENFFDITYAYRFGPLAHSVTIATLHTLDSDEPLGEAFHFPDGRSLERIELGLSAGVEQHGDGGWYITVSTERCAQSVRIIDRHFRPDVDYFHLSPTAPRRIRLSRRTGAKPDSTPAGDVVALNGTDRPSYRAIS